MRQRRKDRRCLRPPRMSALHRGARRAEPPALRTATSADRGVALYSRVIRRLRLGARPERTRRRLRRPDAFLSLVAFALVTIASRQREQQWPCGGKRGRFSTIRYFSRALALLSHGKRFEDPGIV